METIEMKGKRSSRPLTISFVIVAIAATALFTVTRAHAGKPLAVKALAAPGVPAGDRFIVPDDQLPARTEAAPAGPQVHPQEKNGPRSMSFAAELQRSLAGSFQLTVASDIPDFVAAAIVLEGATGKVVGNVQTLPRPIPLSSVVNMSLTPDVAPIPAPSYTQRSDGSVVVSLSEPSGVVVAIARPDGSFVRLESLGNLGGPAPVQVAELQAIALRHFGLS